MGKEELKAYLEQVHALEMDIYTMDEAIQQLKSRRRVVRKKQEYDKPCRRIVAKPKEDTSKGDMAYRITWFLGTVVIAFLSVISLGILLAIVISVFGFFGSKFLGKQVEGVVNTAVNGQKQRAQQKKQEKWDTQYENEFAEYRKNIQSEDTRYDAEFQEVSKYNADIDRQIGEIQQAKEATKQTLDRLYAVGVIYPKYRALVPVTMFCEYIASGRRGVLEGTNGMYDLYESEIRAGIIISELQKIKEVMNTISHQLGTISGQLNNVRESQFMLYNAMEKGNEMASQLCASMESIAKSTEAAAGNTAAMRDAAEWTAFNTEAIARRTEAMARIQEYEHTLKHPVFHA